jgi:hypothetical protein
MIVDVYKRFIKTQQGWIGRGPTLASEQFAQPQQAREAAMLFKTWLRQLLQARLQFQMPMQELISGQLRLTKLSSSRISDLRPGSQVFALSALSAQRKILGQFHNVKSVQADTVFKFSKLCDDDLRHGILIMLIFCRCCSRAPT